MNRCPHCESAIDCDAAWRNTDYQSVFRYVCGECDGVVEITVSMCPEFAVDFPHCEKCERLQAIINRLHELHEVVIPRSLAEAIEEEAY